ncbi:LacI family DNA-binding transcriptional regulator [Kribbella sp. NPDC026611]|uniref:LacI family DNA-binding transcriptional regulator n=1 Tax=Kribbella sp. NPDC026611 TaxID=3154911 RepID=UPI0033C78DEB
MTDEGASGRRRASTGPTLADVAAHAGVSPATVSRVLADNYPVSRSARQRVQRSIRELNYSANTHARALAAGAGSKTMAFILADVRGQSFADAAHGVEQEAAQRGWLTLIGTTQGVPERELALVQLMREQRAGAVILIGGVTDEADEYRQKMTELANSLHAAGSLLVLCGRPPLGDGVPAAVIEYDNENGAYALTSHLLSQGHRRILFLAGPERHSTSIERLAGYRRALTDFGVPDAPELIEHGVFTRASGYQLTRRRLTAGHDFTAVFAGTDVVAAGVYAAANEQGLSVPEDLSVVGYDDVELAQDLRPRLTTVHVPYEDLGRTAAQIAVADQHLQPGWAGYHRLFKTHVVIRSSVSRVR